MGAFAGRSLACDGAACTCLYTAVSVFADWPNESMSVPSAFAIGAVATACPSQSTKTVVVILDEMSDDSSARALISPPPTALSTVAV